MSRLAKIKYGFKGLIIDTFVDLKRHFVIETLKMTSLLEATDAKCILARNTGRLALVTGRTRDTGRPHY